MGKTFRKLIDIVVLEEKGKDPSVFWQMFGRAARAPDRKGMAASLSIRPPVPPLEFLEFFQLMKYQTGCTIGVRCVYQ
jgi:hypothetical protein